MASDNDVTELELYDKNITRKAVYVWKLSTILLNSLWIKEEITINIRNYSGEFPGGPVVRTSYFQCRVHGFDPGQGTKIPQTVQCGKKKPPTIYIYVYIYIYIYTYIYIAE